MSNKKIKVYGRPSCKACEFTTRMLDKNQVPYSYIDVSANAAAAEEVKDMGYSSVPVVVTADEKWTGFRPDRIGKYSPSKEHSPSKEGS